MESIKDLYKIGPGPSSSHTIGPQKIMAIIKKTYSSATSYKVILYGSLSLTGKGHLTDYIIKKSVEPLYVDVVFSKEELEYHPNGMEIIVFEDRKMIGSHKAYSVGGGSIYFEGASLKEESEIYPHNSLHDIFKYITENNLDLYSYALAFEDEDFLDYITLIWATMKETIDRGLHDSGIIPGKLKLSKVAKDLYELALSEENANEKENLFVTSYAYAVSEQNASGGIVVTAPTCGASGLLPAVLYYCHKQLGYSEEMIIKALIVGGVIGNLIKKNATISGAQGGCQAEIGTACSMASASYAYLQGLSLSQIEYAAEMGLEHFLGLTCDPIGGYVQIPCIERNGFGALRALSTVIFAKNLGKLRSHRISFDSMVSVMKKTGEDMKVDYRETALGGLAKQYPIENDDES